jgi:hypothetical protein
MFRCGRSRALDDLFSVAGVAQPVVPGRRVIARKLLRQLLATAAEVIE